MNVVNDLKNVERNMKAFNDANFALGFVMCSIMYVHKQDSVYGESGLCCLVVRH